MELTYGFLYNQKAKMALNRLAEIPMHGKIISNLITLRKQLDNEFKSMKKEFEAIVKQYSELDEKGNVKEPQGPGSFIPKAETITEFNEKVSKLMEKKFEIKASKFPYDVIIDRNFDMSVSDLESLEPVLHGFPSEGNL